MEKTLDNTNVEEAKAMSKEEAIKRLINFRDWTPKSNFDLVSADDLKEAIDFIVENLSNFDTEHDELSNMLP